jgi:NADH-quinone oxidoreductase subunit J
MGKYMIAFEGAGLMILLGIFGAVLVQRPATPSDTPDRDKLGAAIDEPPPPVEDDALEPEVLDLREDEDR